jgi:hypothetical protein
VRAGLVRLVCAGSRLPPPRLPLSNLAESEATINGPDGLLRRAVDLRPDPPDHDAQRRADYKRTTPEQRVAQAIELSRVATRLAPLGYDQLGDSSSAATSRSPRTAIREPRAPSSSSLRQRQRTNHACPLRELRRRRVDRTHGRPPRGSSRPDASRFRTGRTTAACMNAGGYLTAYAIRIASTYSSARR